MELCLIYITSLVRSLPSNKEEITTHVFHLKCFQCNATLYKPTTLGNGVSYCLLCVPKIKNMQDLIIGKALDFGKHENKVLTEISQKCAPELYKAAQLRHASNDFFRQKKYQLAIDGYTATIQLYAQDAVVFGNRAAAHMKVLNYNDALIDIKHAIHLLLQDGGVTLTTITLPLCIKFICRYASCLESKEDTSNTSTSNTSTSNTSTSNTSTTMADLIQTTSLYLLVVVLYQEMKQKIPKTIQTKLDLCLNSFDDSTILITHLKQQIVGINREDTKTSNDTPNEDNNTPNDTSTSTTNDLTNKRKRKYQRNDLDQNSTQWKFIHPQRSMLSLFGIETMQDKKQENSKAQSIPKSISTTTTLLLDKSKLNEIKECLRCPLCFETFHEPTTLPCGHVLCRPCLARTLDHSFTKAPSCPMCRFSLAPMLNWLNVRARQGRQKTGDKWSHGGRQISSTIQINNLLQMYFPDECALNIKRYSKEESCADNMNNPTSRHINIPIFCCSVALPGVKTGLHIFEPRYRLMMRRCIESGNKKFGMCLSKQHEYGTMLRILDFEQLSDGRSRIECIGEERFKVKKWGEKDGYSTGEIEWVDTTVDLSNDVANDEVNAVKVNVQNIRLGLRRVLAPSIFSQIEEMFGSAPSLDITYVFWCASMLSALRIIPQDKLYELAFGDAYEVKVIGSSPIWRKIEDGSKASLRISHRERVNVLQVFTDAVLAASEGKNEDENEDDANVENETVVENEVVVAIDEVIDSIVGTIDDIDE